MDLKEIFHELLLFMIEQDSSEIEAELTSDDGSKANMKVTVVFKKGGD
jgi:hypothetical protein